MDRLLRLFADILDYPGDDLLQKAVECGEATEAAGRHAEGLADFCRLVQSAPPGKMQEIYTATFDLNASASPYVGYHLFGDGYQRSAFLLELQRRYREHGHSTGVELADHLCVILRFLSRCGGPSERQVLIDEALVPALESMIGKTNAERPDAAPYRMALGALHGVLKGG